MGYRGSHMRPPAHRMSIAAYPSRASWLQRELNRRPQKQCPHAAPRPTHVNFGASLTRSVAPHGAPHLAPVARPHAAPHPPHIHVGTHVKRSVAPVVGSTCGPPPTACQCRHTPYMFRAPPGILRGMCRHEHALGGGPRVDPASGALGLSSQWGYDACEGNAAMDMRWAEGRMWTMPLGLQVQLHNWPQRQGHLSIVLLFLWQGPHAAPRPPHANFGVPFTRFVAP